MSDLCKWTGKAISRCKCGDCESHTVKHGDNRWVQPVCKGYKLECCDCGLVHSFEFRIHLGKIQFRASRDNRRTAIRRRKRDVVIKREKYMAARKGAA